MPGHVVGQSSSAIAAGQKRYPERQQTFELAQVLNSALPHSNFVPEHFAHSGALVQYRVGPKQGTTFAFKPHSGTLLAQAGVQEAVEIALGHRKASETVP